MGRNQWLQNDPHKGHNLGVVQAGQQPHVPDDTLLESVVAFGRHEVTFHDFAQLPFHRLGVHTVHRFSRRKAICTQGLRNRTRNCFHELSAGEKSHTHLRHDQMLLLSETLQRPGKQQLTFVTECINAPAPVDHVVPHVSQRHQK
jgi:hypothetical protein